MQSRNGKAVSRALLRYFLKFASFLQLKPEYIQGEKGTNFQYFS